MLLLMLLLKHSIWAAKKCGGLKNNYAKQRRNALFPVSAFQQNEFLDCLFETLKLEITSVPAGYALMIF
ncbi:MAG: hypothetical protein ACXV2C_08530 [Candidatus Bathyarchaeia archaeon]